MALLILKKFREKALELLKMKRGELEPHDDIRREVIESENTNDTDFRFDIKPLNKKF